MAKILLLVCLVALASYVAADCSNLLIAACVNGCPAGASSTPVQRTDNTGVCPHITGLSCCPSQTFVDLKNVFTLFRDGVQELIDEFSKLKDIDIPDFNDWFKEAFGQPCSDALLNGVTTCADLSNFYDQVVTTTKNFYKVFPSDVVGCIKGVLEFYAGMLCLLCDPNASDFVYVNASGILVVNISESVCTSLVGDCSHMFIDVVNYAHGIAVALESFNGDQLGAQFQEVIAELESIQSPCVNEAVCNSYICNQFLVFGGDGFGNVNFGGSGGLGNRTVIPMVPNTFVTRSMFNRGVQDEGVTPNYVKSNGYQASSVGSGSNLDTSVSSGGSNGAETVILSIAALVVAAIAFTA